MHAGVNGRRHRRPGEQLASAYGRRPGGFGVGLALMAAVALIATFWVWIAAVMGIYWERKAGSAVVARMEELSAGRARS
jgi:hypothetical protein